AVAEDIVRGAEARIDVLPRGCVNLVEMRGGVIHASGHRLLGYPLMVVIETQAEIEREAPRRPLILGIERNVVPAYACIQWRRIISDRCRSSIEQLKYHRTQARHLIHVRVFTKQSEIVLKPRLEGMRSSYVRNRQAIVQLIATRDAIVGHGDGSRAGECGVVTKARSQVNDRNSSRIRPLGRGKTNKSDWISKTRDAGLNQEFVAAGICPGPLCQQRRREINRPASFGRSRGLWSLNRRFPNTVATR